MKFSKTDKTGQKCCKVPANLLQTPCKVGVHTIMPKKLQSTCKPIANPLQTMCTHHPHTPYRVCTPTWAGMTQG